MPVTTGWHPWLYAYTRYAGLVECQHNHAASLRLKRPIRVPSWPQSDLRTLYPSAFILSPVSPSATRQNRGARNVDRVSTARGSDWGVIRRRCSRKETRWSLFRMTFQWPSVWPFHTETILPETILQLEPVPGRTLSHLGT